MLKKEVFEISEVFWDGNLSNLLSLVASNYLIACGRLIYTYTYTFTLRYDSHLHV